MQANLKPGDRIKLGCVYLSTSQVEISVKIGVDKAEISKIGKTYRDEKSKVVLAVADALGCTPTWLLTGEGVPPAWSPDHKKYEPGGMPQLALVGHTSAGDGDVYEDFPEPLAFPVPSDWVVVRVDGDSAYPVVYAGQFVVLDIRRTQSASTLDAAAIHDLDNNICMVRTMAGKSLLKRLCEAATSPDGFTLASINAGLSSPWVARTEIETVTPIVGVIYEDPTQERRKGRVSAPKHKGVNRQ